MQKTILITGASRGIGFDTVLELAKNPENHVIALSRNIEKLSALKNISPDNITIHAFDITSFTEKELDKITVNFEKIDILINNAGVLISKPFEEQSMEDWKLQYEVNLFGPVNLIKHLLPKLKAAPSAHILNIGSMGGFQGSAKFPGLSAYSGSKAALANLSECLAEELKETSVRCNCLCLGAVNTEMLNQAFPGFQAPVNSPDMAHFIADFGLNAHQFLNGKVIPVSLSNP